MAKLLKDLLRAFLIVVIVSVFIAIPLGAVGGMEYEVAYFSIADALHQKAVAKRIMFGAGAAGVAAATCLYLIDRRRPAGLVRLQGQTRLERLNLSGAHVTDAGLAHLKGLTQLEWLDLSETQVTDAGLVHLMELTTLKRLDLRGAQVTASGIAELQKALPECQIFASAPAGP